MPDVSPTKWHLAHVSWFFETMVLRPHVEGYVPMDERFEFLFNSYYNTIGAQFSRPRRGLLTRPTVQEVLSYRARVDDHMLELLGGGIEADVAELIELGLHHEQQHR